MTLFAALLAVTAPQIVDVHRHVGWPWSDHDTVRQDQLETMEQAGIDMAVVSVTGKEDVARWQGAPVIVGVKLACPRNKDEPRYNCFPEREGWPDLAWLEAEIKARRVGALHELAPNYYGISPASPRLAPYWALAARHDIPVGIHTQRGPAPGSPYSVRSDPNCCPDYDPAMGNPALLRPVLAMHPTLRIWLQHVGAGRGDHAPFWPETLALLRDYPNLYVDLSITNGAMPLDQYEGALRKLIDAGYGDRIMFGSDNLPVGPILDRLRSFAWLSDAQREAILRRNAERFFRLTDPD